jgi:hypothetical protein
LTVVDKHAETITLRTSHIRTTPIRTTLIYEEDIEVAITINIHHLQVSLPVCVPGGSCRKPSELDAPQLLVLVLDSVLRKVLGPRGETPVLSLGTVIYCHSWGFPIIIY